MRSIVIEQHDKTGILKSWKISSKDDFHMYTFGVSKFAQLRSCDATISGIQACFTFEGNMWRYFDLQKKQTIHALKLNQPQVIEFPNSKLTVKVVEEVKPLFKSTSDFESISNGKTIPYALVLIYNSERLLESKVIPLKQGIALYKVNYESPAITTATAQTQTLRLQPTSEWKIDQYDDYQIHYRSLNLNDMKYMTRTELKNFFNKEEALPFFATLAGAVLLAGLFLLAPSAQDAGEAAQAALPPKEFREIKMKPPIKKKSAEALKAQAPVKQAVEQPPAGETKSVAKILGQSRVSALIGKISASAAKSKNIVISQGAAPDSGVPTGRALASIGQVKSNDQSWGPSGNTKGIQISTAGRAAGKGVGAYGAINAGKAGSGDAQLLEDESVIVGGLDREVIAEYIRSQLGQILYCYERQLSATPDLFGKVSIRFTIDGKGGVETQKVNETTLKNAAVEGCILQKVAKWKFPAPDGGTKVNVTYPFLFKSTN